MGVEGVEHTREWWFTSVPVLTKGLRTGNSRRKGPSINPTVSKSPLILFDRSRACNLIVRITNDPFVPQHSGGAASAPIYIRIRVLVFQKLLHTIIGGCQLPMFQQNIIAIKTRISKSVLCTTNGICLVVEGRFKFHYLFLIIVIISV